MSTWHQVKETWRDEACRRFEKQYVDLLASEINASLLAMEQIEAAVRRAQQDCSTREELDV